MPSASAHPERFQAEPRGASRNGDAREQPEVGPGAPEAGSVLVACSRAARKAPGFPASLRERGPVLPPTLGIRHTFHRETAPWLRRNNMSQATKRKHVVKEVLEDYVVPSERQRIVRVLGTPGNNLHEVETPEGARFLASMPTKFRKNIWIKRGDFVLVDPIEEGEKVKAEISFVLYKDHVRYLKKEGYWPDAFLEDGPGSHSRAKESREGAQSPPRSAGEEDSEDDGDLFVNTNRAGYGCAESEDNTSSSEEEEEEK